MNHYLGFLLFLVNIMACSTMPTTELGYHYLNNQQIEQALDIFKWNVEVYPNSWNVYDSLGEGYKMAGETQLAIENYEKSIELNPENEEGKKILEELKKG